MSSEIIDDIRVSTLEIASDSGLNLSNYNARLKHTGAGTFTFTSTSALDNAISIDLPNGGLDVNVEKTIDFKALDSTETAITLQALAGGIGITAIKNIQLTSTNENINLNTQVGDINLESMNSININSERSSSDINNSIPGVHIVSNRSKMIIEALSSGISGYINTDIVLYSDGSVIIDANGISGILIGTDNSVPITMGTTDNLTTVNGDLTIEGNLIVNGESVQNNITVFTSEDPVFYLNNGITDINNTSDIGFIGKRGNYENVGWIWKESQDEWVAIGTDSNGVDNIDNEVNDYKPARFGGLNVVSDTSRGPTATVFNVDVNGQININTTTTGGINIGNVYSNSPINIGTSSSNITTNSNNYNLFSQSNIGITAVGNLNIGTTGSLNITSVASQNIFSQSNIGITAVGNLNIGTTGSLNITSVGSQNIFSQSNIGITAVGNLNIGTTGSLNITSVAGTNITNTGNSSVALVINQNGTGQDVAVFKDNGITALIVKDGGNVGINTSNPGYPLDVNGTANPTSVYQAGFLLVPTGAMMPYAASIAPGGWLLCDGLAVSRSAYSALFALIGSTYGNGDGVNTFNLPNLKGRTIFGFNSSDPSFSLGLTGGSKTATLTTNELPAHTHTTTTSSNGSHSHTYNDAYFAENQGGAGGGKFGTSSSTDNDNSFYWRTAAGGSSTSPSDINTSTVIDHSHTVTVGSTGSGNSFSILNPYITLNYIIKY